MALHFLSHRRLALPVVIATVLAGGGGALGAGMQNRAVDRTSADATAPLHPRAVRATAAAAMSVASTATAVPEPRDIAAAIGASRPHLRPSLGRGATVRPRAAAAVESRSSTVPPKRGRNHVWIPALGIDRSVVLFPCSRKRPPDDHLYRWGCAGRNNIYLMGHAHSALKPLHDAYLRGRLSKGLQVTYADDAGRVTTYAVIWWKVTRPTAAAAWAWAPQPRPSMTLQTCVGANSEYRLMVRLVATD